MTWTVNSAVLVNGRRIQLDFAVCAVFELVDGTSPSLSALLHHA